MRLMLGTEDTPWILVETESESLEEFKFTVVNGAWQGKFQNGKVTILRDGTTFEGVQILCKDQEKLAGSYTKVFMNYPQPLTQNQKRIILDYYSEINTKAVLEDTELDVSREQVQEAWDELLSAAYSKLEEGL